MATVIYGVSGEGSGHSSRSREIVTHLLSRGHKVQVVSYDRGARNLKDDFDVFEVEGLHIDSSDNKVSVLGTFTDNFKRLLKGHKRFQALRREVFKRINPDCVMTDFEPMTAYLANHYDLPLISIDNQHRMRYMAYPMPPGLKKDSIITKNIIRTMIPKPDVSLITTFYFGKTKNNRSFCFPPILRKEVLSLTPENEQYILVYLTSGFESFVEKLCRFQRERFIVYGYNRSEQDGNITFKKPSREGFLRDLAGCRAVMATAGFTLMTESLHLRKPFMALPMRGQFEQELNGYLLAKLGYGKNVRSTTDDVVSSFLYHIDDYAEALAEIKPYDSSAIKNKIDELLADDCSFVKEYHNKRRDNS